MAKAPRIVNVHRAEVGTHGHGVGFNHQNRRRGVLGQSCPPAQQQVFEAALQVGVQGGADQRRAVRTIQAPRQQRRQARFQSRGEQQRFFQRLIHSPLRPYLILGQTPQHLVPRHLRPLGMTVRPQAARRLRQHGQ